MGISGAEFQAMLERENMTDANAARILAVHPRTVREWCETGPKGTAAVFLSFLAQADVPLRHVADRLGIQLGGFWRNQYPRR
jgi:hypothetical protein